MRILLDYRPALRERTGVGEFVHELARALGARLRGAGGDEVAILTTSFRDRPEATLAGELPGVQIVDRRIPVRPLTWSWNRLGWPPVETLAGPADVVHSQTPLLIPSTTAAGVVTIHDLDFLTHPDRTRAEMRRDFPALARRHAERADHIVVSSQYAAGQVVKHLDVGRERITVCSPGRPAWAPAIADERAARHNGSVILFVGTVESRKNIGGLLDAYAQLRARRADTPALVVAGRIAPDARALVGRTAKSGLGAFVDFRGYVSDTDRRRLYRAARMLVLPSFEEGFGLPVLEAMACGVPVVISDRGSLPEVAGAAALPVPPDQSEAIATRMEQLLDADAAKVAVAHGLAQAAKYTWEACATAALEAYRLAVAARTERGS